MTYVREYPTAVPDTLAGALWASLVKLDYLLTEAAERGDLPI